MKVKEDQITKTRKSNWPPINFLCIKPIIYHNIVEDIPEDRQKLIRRAYWTWFATGICFLWNLFTVASALVVQGSGADIASTILAAIEVAFFIPMSFLIYRILYQAARRGRPSLYFVYFITMFLEVVVFVWEGIGLSSWGGGGFVLMLSLFNQKHTAVGIFSVICFVLWCLLVLVHVFIFIFARLQYRRLGGLAKAKQEAAEEATQKMAENPDLVAKGVKSLA